MVRALLFDLYETLVTERRATPVRASSLGERLGLDARAFRTAWKPQRIRVVRGELSLADALTEIGAALGHSLDPALVRAACDARRCEKAALFEQFDEEALTVLHQLNADGVKLAVVSNGFAEDVHAWPRCQAAQWFDASVFSFEIGAAKPEPAIYRETLRRLDVPPGRAVFIGDGGDDELLGAERAGLRAAMACWFRRDRGTVPASVPRLTAWRAVRALAEAG